MNDATPLIEEAPEEFPLSAILREFMQWPRESITIEEMLLRFGRRSHGAILFVFAAPNLLPLPPGSSTALGAPLMLVAPQVMFGMAAPWLPKALRARSVSRSVMGHAFSRMIPYLERIERVSRPRLGFFFGPVADRCIGTVCSILAFILILPIPLGNMLPASAIAALGLSMIQKDGVIAIAGYVLTAVSATVLALTYSLAVAVFVQLWHWLPF